MQLLKPKVFQSTDATQDKPIYTPGYNSSGYEEFVNSKNFAKKSKKASASKGSNNKLAARHTFPGVTPKRSKSPSLQNSMIWKRSTNSSKADVKDLLEFVKKSIEHKEKMNSVRKSVIKNESIGTTPTTENFKHLPPIMTKKATIHTSTNKFSKNPNTSQTRFFYFSKIKFQIDELLCKIQYLLSYINIKYYFIHRCGVCQKKLKITENYTCKCNRNFCLKHRLPEQHNCDFDYKKEGKEKLAKDNPKVESSKIEKL